MQMTELGIIGFVIAACGDVALFAGSNELWKTNDRDLSYALLAFAAVGAAFLLAVAWRWGMAI
jgi:hypothetical protein